jgi:hypothetical protein
MTTSKAPYSFTSNLAIQPPIPTYLQDPVTSRKDKQVYHHHAEAIIPPSPTQSDHRSRDQHTALNALDHGKTHRQRSPTLERSQNIIHDRSLSIDIMRQIPTIKETNQNIKLYEPQGEKSANGDPIVLPSSAMSPSPLSAFSAANSQSPHSNFHGQQHHFFRASSPSISSSSMPRLGDSLDGNRSEKSALYARSDHSLHPPQLLARHSMMLPSLPDFEVEAFCPSCQKWVMTRIRYRSGAGVWLFSFVL